MMKRKIYQVKIVACPKWHFIVPYKHYQTGVTTDEIACSTCVNKKSISCNYVTCTYEPS
jgi:hypothetical protein